MTGALSIVRFTGVLALTLQVGAAEASRAAEIVELTSFNLLSFGTPMLRGPIEAVVCQPFFLEDGRWRMNMVFQDRIVVLEEGKEQTTISLSEEGNHSALCSANGLFVVVQLHAMDGQVNTLEIVNVEEHSVHLIRDVPGVSWDVVWVLDDGALLQMGRDIDAEANPEGPVRLRRFSSDGSLEWQRETSLSTAGVSSASSNGTRICYVDHHEDEPQVICLSGDGELLWQRTEQELSRERPEVSPDGSVVLVIREGLLVCLDGTTGEERWSSPFEGTLGNLLFSADGGSWAGELMGSLAGSSRIYALMMGDADGHASSTPVIVPTYRRALPVAVSRSGRAMIMLLGTTTPVIPYRFALVENSVGVLWLSPPHPSDISELQAGGSTLVRSLRPSPVEIDLSGEHLVFWDSPRVVIASCDGATR